MNNDNAEFIKKVCELSKYLYIKGNLTEEDLDLIIKSRVGKHETVIKEIYLLIADIALYDASQEWKMKMFQKISNMPEEQWDDDYIRMIRDFS